MIVFDTNIISELMRPEPDPKVLSWVDAAGRLHTSAITVAEVEYGIARLADGRRRDLLATTAAEVFAAFRELILPFDDHAAHHYGQIVAGREAGGRPISVADAQIAAICASRGALLATRNTRDFEGTGISTINPWE